MKIDYLTINIYMNAWLDCCNPFISIHNKYDDKVLAHFNSRELLEVIEQGDIDIEDLKSTDAKLHMEVISILLAKKAKQKIKEQILALRFNRKDRATSVIPFPTQSLT